MQKFLPAVLTVAMAASAHASDIPVRNLAPEFVTVFDATAQLPPPARVAAMRELLMAEYPEFYSRHKPEKLDRLIQKALDSFPGIRSAYLDKSQKFGASLDQHMRTFGAAFPNYRNTTPITLVHSLGEMDGGPRELNGKVHLVFGADVMAATNPEGDAAPLFHHELFHLLHRQKFSCETQPVWTALWGEGLAVYVSKTINPGANENELLLDFPKGMAANTRAMLPAAWAQLQTVLDNTDDDAALELFSTKAKDATLPVRRGYYLGYLVAKEAGKTRDMATLAALDCKQVRELVGETVRKLAKESNP
jgi:hypothetical protein